jgi:hypothetical protein
MYVRGRPRFTRSLYSNLQDLLCFTKELTAVSYNQTRGASLLIRIVRLLKETPLSESASELFRSSDRHLSVKLVPTFADRGCRVVSWIPTAVFSDF